MDNDNKENAPPSNRHNGHWIDGLKYDACWPSNKKYWYLREFEKCDKEGWKKRRTKFDKQRAALE